jgi:hypothetical protein
MAGVQTYVKYMYFQVDMGILPSALCPGMRDVVVQSSTFWKFIGLILVIILKEEVLDDTGMWPLTGEL